MWSFSLLDNFAKKISLIVCFIFCLGPPNWGFAAELSVVELFRYGSIEEHVSEYRIGRSSGIFLKLIRDKQERCIHLDQMGSYSTQQLEEELGTTGGMFEFFTCNLQALALRMKSPAQMLVHPAPRGNFNQRRQKPDELFEDVWRTVVQNRTNSIPSNNLVAAAIWFSQNGNFARSAYLLEKGHQIYKSDWILQLTRNAYGETTREEIEREIEQTQYNLNNFYSPSQNIALLIGVQDYLADSGWEDLKTPLSDIQELRKVLIQEYKYDPERIFSLENATYQEILDSLAKIREIVGPKSNVLIYYAGHGWVDDDNEYFWIPSDGKQSQKSWVYTDYVLTKIRNLQALHTLVIVDSCFSGALNQHQDRGAITGGIRKLYQRKSRQLITAGGNEPVSDGGKGENSIFAGSFLEILKNQSEDQPLSAELLFTRLQPNVANNSNQTPTYDRIVNSQDQWGQFYFIKNPQQVNLTPSEQSFKDKGANSEKENSTEKQEANEKIDSLYDLRLPEISEGEEERVKLFFHRSENVINSKDLVDNKNVIMTGFVLALTIQIGSQPILLQFDYAEGAIRLKDSISYGGYSRDLSQKIEHRDFRVGGRFLGKLRENGLVGETGVYFYWKSLQVEWEGNLEGRDTEFVNRGFFFLELQHYQGFQFNDFLDLGLNFDLRAGGGNHSGSTKVARSEKYNTDTSNFVLGTRLGIEARGILPVIPLELRVGASYEYLWQPFDDDGGLKGGEDKINSSQDLFKLYLSFGLSF